MTITALPTPPSTNDPANFAVKADALLAALPTFVAETNATAAAMNLNSTTDTSVSSVAIGTGTKSFTVSTGKSFQPGMYLILADSAAPSTNSIFAQITSYNTGTGALVVEGLTVRGSGTKSSWVISQSSAGGAQAGPIASSGITGAAVAGALASSGITGAAASGAVTASGLTMATSRLLGRTTTSTGAVEEISVGAGLTLSGGVLATTATGITLGTTVAATTGTSIDFTGIPATAKRITINFAEVSLSGTAALLVHLGDSGGIETSGYVASVTNGSSAQTASTTGFVLTNNPGTAASTYSGSVVLSLENSSVNRWCEMGNISRSVGPFLNGSAGVKALSAVLDRVRITTDGADTFDSGEINISYE